MIRLWDVEDQSRHIAALIALCASTEHSSALAPRSSSRRFVKPGPCWTMLRVEPQGTSDAVAAGHLRSVGPEYVIDKTDGFRCVVGEISTDVRIFIDNLRWVRDDPTQQ